MSKLNKFSWGSRKIQVEVDPEEENHYRDLSAKTPGDGCSEVEPEEKLLGGRFKTGRPVPRVYLEEEEPDREKKKEPQTFDEIAQYICDLHRMKNADYDDSAYESYKEFGLISYVQRIGDKYRRAKNLTLNPENQQIKTETIEDTLMDLAAYSIMALEALRK